MQKFTLTIKSYMIIFLAIIAISSILFTIKNYSFFIQIILAPLFAALIDLLITYVKEKKLFLPSSAIISGLFIAVIFAQLPLHILFIISLIAIVSKHVIKIHGRHIFNPAAFGIVVGGLIFGYATSWWAVSLLVIPLGLFIVYKQRKWRLAFSFLVTYFILVVLTNLSSLSNIMLLDTTAIFFALFMLIEPMTSTYTKKAMIVQGTVVGVLVTVFRTFLPQVDLFLASLLVANIFVEIMNKRLR